MTDRVFAEKALPEIIKHLSNGRYVSPSAGSLVSAARFVDAPSQVLLDTLAMHIGSQHHERDEIINGIIQLSPGSAGVFTRMLDSEDYSDRYNGALGLQALGDPGARTAVPRLLHLVMDESLTIDQSKHFAWVLSTIGLEDEATPDEMIQLLKGIYALNPKSLSEDSRSEIYYTHNSGMQSALREMDAAAQMANSIERLVASLGATAVEPLVSAAGGLYNIDPVQWGSTKQYSNPGWDSQLRLRSIAMLGMVGPEAESALPFLVKTLKENVGKLDYYSTWGLYGDKIDVPSNRARLAAEALGRIGVASDEVILALLNAANMDDPDLRSTAVAALERLSSRTEGVD